ncbi:hypothetical protein TSH58p_22690 (plasmid) [Azospirillum sp. TSH58]|uniref:DUF7210 family protein n=1 Tax=Azospirillum sp. TSH58 TaxID=664962 RepID=UPI000D5FF770|nr:hypothetical protein [Azospirillum sp. TSH58]AWJ86326.1 hypothetical protein TSH58p_22690 [Azospirillum sp. TSH58]PWC73424.1 hypothetical protein TSH58_04425 [Azospirillum sp. TSH58]
MKIRTLISVKHDGKLHAPGVELDVKDALGKDLIEAGRAEKVLVEPPADTAETETGKPAPAKNSKA